MATVHAGWQLAIDRPVAIKVVRADRADDPASLAALVTEARRASRVHHPHVVTIFDCDHLADGRPVIVMERLSGRTWAEWVAADSPGVDAVLGCTRQLCAGLTAIHDKGLLHGDLSARNVFVRPVAGLGAWVTLLDFGISRVLGSVAGQRVWGTPGTMPPEQLQGGVLDARSDLWALGVLLHLGLTHRLPFPTGAEALPAILAGPTLETLSARPDLPPGLVDLLAALLAADPRDRPQSAEAVGVLLAGLGADLPAAPRPDGPERWDVGSLLPTGRRIASVTARRGGWVDAAICDALQVELYEAGPNDRLWALRLVLSRDLVPLLDRSLPRGLQPVRHAGLAGSTLCIQRATEAGERLSTRLARLGPVGWQRALVWTRQLAAGIGALHGAGVSHRWVSPSSVFVAESDQHAILTGVGRASLAAVGVPSMAPEVLALAASDTGPAVDGPAQDWRGLGLTLRAMLSGDLASASTGTGAPASGWVDVPEGVRRLVATLCASDAAPDGVDAVLSAIDEVLSRPRNAPDLRRDVAAPGPLVGRSQAMAMLRSGLEDAVEGAGSVWWVRGPTGSGRSRLLQEVASLARSAGARVWRLGAPGPSGSGAAQLAAEVAHHLDALPSELAEHMRGRVARALLPHLSVLAPLSPVFVALGGAAAPEASHATDPRTLRVARSRALTDLLLAVLPPKDAPSICLLVDDVEAMDDAVGAMLARLPLQAEALPLLCVVGGGPVFQSDPRTEDLRLAERHGACIVELGPLSSEAMTALLAGRLGPTLGARLGADVHALTGGLPGAVTGLLQSALATGALARDGGKLAFDPRAWAGLELEDDLQHTLHDRLSQQPPLVREVAGAVGIWGTTTPTPVLAALCEAPLDALVAAAVTAVQAGLLRERPGDGWTLSHESLGAVVSRGGLPHLHRRAARVWAARSGTRALLQQVHHLERAGWEDADAGPLEQAARQLVSEGRAGRAREVLDHLMVHVDTPALRVLRGQAARRQGAEAAAASDLELAWRSKVLRKDPVRFAQVTRTLSQVLFALGRTQRAETVLREALDHLGRPAPQGRMSGPRLLWLLLSQLVVAPGRLPVPATDVSPVERASNPLLGALARVKLLSDPRETLAIGLVGLQRGRAAGDRENLARALAGYATLFSQATGWLGLSRRLCSAAERMAGEVEPLRPHIGLARLDRLFAEGHLDSVAAGLPEVTASVLAWGDRTHHTMLAHARHRVAVHNGRLHDVLNNVMDVAGLLEGPYTTDSGPPGWLSELLFTRTCAVAGRVDLALSLLEGQLGRSEVHLGDLVGNALRGARIGLLAHLGRVDAALSAWAKVQVRSAVGHRLHTADWSTETLGLWAQTPAADRIPRGLWRLADRASRPYPLFRLLLDIARHDALVRQGSLGRARRLLRRSLPLARRVGGLPGARLLGRQVSAVGGPTSPEGRALLDEALRLSADATPGLPALVRLQRLDGQVPSTLPDTLPWGPTARAVGLGPAFALLSTPEP